MMHKTFITLAVVDGIASVAVLGGWLVAQIAPHVVPEVSNGWQLAAFLGLLGLNAWSMWVQNQANKVTQSKVDVVADKTEVVHKALNSQLDAFKRDAADQYKAALDQAVKLTRTEGENELARRVSGLDAKIASLESRLEAATVRAATVAKEGPATPRGGV